MHRGAITAPRCMGESRVCPWEQTTHEVLHFEVNRVTHWHLHRALLQHMKEKKPVGLPHWDAVLGNGWVCVDVLVQFLKLRPDQPLPFPQR